MTITTIGKKASSRLFDYEDQHAEKFKKIREEGQQKKQQI
jgi:hypothetical protein